MARSVDDVFNCRISRVVVETRWILDEPCILPSLSGPRSPRNSIQSTPACILRDIRFPRNPRQSPGVKASPASDESGLAMQEFPTLGTRIAWLVRWAWDSAAQSADLFPHFLVAGVRVDRRGQRAHVPREPLRPARAVDVGHRGVHESVEWGAVPITHRGCPPLSYLKA
jgi:hypothetical protein